MRRSTRIRAASAVVKTETVATSARLQFTNKRSVVTTKRALSISTSLPLVSDVASKKIKVEFEEVSKSSAGTVAVKEELVLTASPAQVKTEDGDWMDLCAVRELSCVVTLTSGQVFSWKRDVKSGAWIGVVGEHVYKLREQDERVQYQVVHPPDLQVGQAFIRLHDYFRLEVEAAPLYELWSEKDDDMSKIIKSLPGLRIIRQDPVECLFAFICSSNNNIQRITQMITKLKVMYGELLFNDTASDEKFYAFPSVETMATRVEEQMLRDLGFGYRAPFIVKSSQLLQTLGGREYLLELRNRPESGDDDNAYASQLMQFTGVGRKVADCIGLFSLDKLHAIPVDTHVWQIACREFDPSLKNKKSLTPTIYQAVGDHFRARFSPLAGWAHSVLFAGDLKSFLDQLPEDVQTKRKAATKTCDSKAKKESAIAYSSVVRVIVTSSAGSRPPRDHPFEPLTSSFSKAALAHRRMELTVFVSLTLGIASLLLAGDGTICLAGVDDACLLDRASNIVMVIIGYATVVPIVFCLHAAWDDHRALKAEEQVHLLETGDPPSEKPSRIRTYLYVSHFLSAWGDRMWQFAIPILFIEVFVDTLLPSATFSLVMYTACIITIPSVGRYLDRANRWTVMKYSILLENLMIVLSSIVLGLILLVTSADGVHKPAWTPELVSLFTVTLVCGGIGQVLNDAQTLAIERDWVVVLAGSDSTDLANLNTIMRRIDLSCKILAPMAFGIIMDFAGNDPTTRAMIGAATVGIWNLISTPLEFVMTKDIYDLSPELAIKETNDQDEADDNATAHEARSKTNLVATFHRYIRMWRNYANHPVFLLSFAFCGLYMTILDGGALNTAYLKWRGIPNSILGSSRGAGAVFGLVGTFVFPTIRKWLGGVERVAVVSIWLFWLSLVPVVTAFVITGESQISDYVMLGCMVVSRVWLWSTDLAETQIMQEWIEPSRRGAINSMQTATYQFFYILIQFMGIVFHDPRQFQALVWYSLAAVLASAIGFSVWDLKYGRNRVAYVRRPLGSSPTKEH